MARQTDLTLVELQKILNQGEDADGRKLPGTQCVALNGGLPLGLVINELGMIFLTGGEDGAVAEGNLLALLKESEEKKRSTAYFYLRAGRHRRVASNKTLQQLKNFEDNPQNGETVLRVADRLASSTLI